MINDFTADIKRVLAIQDEEDCLHPLQQLLTTLTDEEQRAALNEYRFQRACRAAAAHPELNEI